jgi:hypothetical protein
MITTEIYAYGQPLQGDWPQQGDMHVVIAMMTGPHIEALAKLETIEAKVVFYFDAPWITWQIPLSARRVTVLTDDEEDQFWIQGMIDEIDGRLQYPALSEEE